MSKPILVDFNILDGDEPLEARVPLQAWASLTDAEIGRRAGVTRERVRQVREKLNLPPSHAQGKRILTWNNTLMKLTNEDWEAYTNKEISEQLGIPLGFIRGWRNRGKKPGAPGSPLHFITDEEWRTVPRVQLAEEYGIDALAINNFMLRYNKPRLAEGQGSWVKHREGDGTVDSEDT